MEKFWMVLIDETASAARRHKTQDLAQEEAERLLGLPGNRGKGVVILEAMWYGSIDKSQVIWDEL